MLSNFLLIAYRNLLRHKVVSAINILGLAVGIAAAVLLAKYVSYELSYDKFHAGSKDIYRIRHDGYKSGDLEYTEALTYHAAAPAIKESLLEVANYVRLHRADGMVNYYPPAGELVSYHETKAFYADSSFFSVFSFPLVVGDAKKVLRNPNSLVVSESAAKKYFGKENPVGKVLHLNTEWKGGEYVVEGVFKDVPENSHIRFDFLFAIESLLHNQQFESGGWYWSNFYTYLVVKPGTDRSALEEKMSSIVNIHRRSHHMGSNYREEFILQPLADIHLHSNIRDEPEVNGDYRMVSFLSIVAFLIAAIAWLNYINLSTAKAAERAREVGMRKILGSGRGLLIRQFLTESLAVTFIAGVLAVALLIICTPLFNDIVDRQITFDVAGQPAFWLAVITIGVFGTFLSGLYPAFILSSFRPLVVVKGKFISGIGGVSLRRAMVVFQFSISIFLIIATVVVYRQLEFMKSADLGVDIDRKVVLNAPRIVTGNSYLNAMDYFKNKALAIPEISHVTASSEVPGASIFWSNEFTPPNGSDADRKFIHVLAVDEDFVSTFDLKLIAGRDFSNKRNGDFGTAAILNESAVRLLGIKDAETAIGQNVWSDAGPILIIGVVRDFHQQSLSQPIDPIMLRYIPWAQSYMTLSFKGGNLKETLKAIENAFHESFPENAFEYFFLDDRFDHQYKADVMSARIFMISSGLSIAIACLGLFGLSLYSTLQRTKEIAVRKVLGASAMRIAVLVSKEFIRLVLIAFVVTAPLGWFLVERWLQVFAYRIDVSVWMFVGAGVLVFLIAIVTVGWQSMRAAMGNVVEAIRRE
jgi:putative ABC transport system permease protein